MSLRLALVPGLATGFARCATPEETGFQLGLPGTRLEMSVARVTPRGPYVEALLRAPGLKRVSYAPADAIFCEVLVLGSEGGSCPILGLLTPPPG